MTKPEPVHCYVHAYTSSAGFQVVIHEDWDTLIEHCAEHGYEYVLKCKSVNAMQMEPVFEFVVEQKRLEMQGKFRDTRGHMRRYV